jgi:hypothetical protein
VKALTVYEAMDGTRFDSPALCMARDEMVSRCRTIAGFLEPVPDTCDFANGSGYVQQNADTYATVRNMLLDICAAYFNGEDALRHIQAAREKAVGEASHSFVGRYLDDSRSLDPVRRVWARLCNIDAQCREWGQPYYAAHPSEAKNVCLNGVSA